jgi:hypothetical protein
MPRLLDCLPNVKQSYNATSGKREPEIVLNKKLNPPARLFGPANIRDDADDQQRPWRPGVGCRGGSLCASRASDTSHLPGAAGNFKALTFINKTGAVGAHTQPLCPAAVAAPNSTSLAGVLGNGAFGNARRAQ